MIILDTDHISVLKYPENPKYALLTKRMQSSANLVFATTIVNVEEQMRGWLAEIHRQHDVLKQLVPYARLLGLFDFFSRWDLVPFDSRSATEFTSLRKKKIRIGTSDLKIAAITLVNEALLLTSNLRDFRRVPYLRVENWLD